MMNSSINAFKKRWRDSVLFRVDSLLETSPLFGIVGCLRSCFVDGWARLFQVLLGFTYQIDSTDPREWQSCGFNGFGKKAVLAHRTVKIYAHRVAEDNKLID